MARTPGTQMAHTLKHQMARTEGGVNDVQYPLTMPKSLKAVVVEAGGVNDVQFFSIPFVRPIFMIFTLLKSEKKLK